METITFEYEGDVTGKATKVVETFVQDDGLFLGDVLEAFADFLRSAGFTYVNTVGVTTDNNPTFNTYQDSARDIMAESYDDDGLEWDQEAFENSIYGC